MVSVSDPSVSMDLVDLDLDPIFFKIHCEGELINGESIDPISAGRLYRQFLTLHLRYPEQTLVPSALLDLIWHFHILDTRKYIEDCNRIFGSYLHHDPYFGIGSEQSRLENQVGWEVTQQLWEREFGEPLMGPSHRCSTKDCR